MQDDGIGLKKKANQITGQGLANMKMRAEKINAHIEFMQKGGFGIRLLVSI